MLLAELLVPTSRFPQISTLDVGLVVPMPTLPLASIRNGEVSGDVASSTTNDGVVPVLVIASLPHGVDELIPTLPAVETVSRSAQLAEQSVILNS